MNHPTKILKMPLPEMLERAAALRDEGHRNVVTYSRKVFIPLTQLCRDVCHYCSFAQSPRNRPEPYLSPEQVLSIARMGESMGCKEALFTLGDKPELRYMAAREALAKLGYSSTLEYLYAVAKLVLEETTLLPHLNSGVLTQDEMHFLRPVAPSMGLMLENVASRLCERDGPHFGSPDKHPSLRLACINSAGQARVPLTSGILIGIGETRQERLDGLYALRKSHRQYGQLQEIIVQNFIAKPGTKMANVTAPDFEELLWTTAAARIVFGPGMSIQVPPNLNPGKLQQLIGAGINDWGGVSPLTVDHVNPESPWPHLDDLADETAAAGKYLTERLTVYPHYVQTRDRWIDPGLHRQVLELCDSEGLGRNVREEKDWAADCFGQPSIHFDIHVNRSKSGGALDSILSKATDGLALSQQEIIRLFQVRGDDYNRVCVTANLLRQQVCGDAVTYVVNRNINYTNVCQYKCTFCAFCKGKTSTALRGHPYLVDLAEISRRVEEAWWLGATEVCLQGGIHPDFTGQTYVDICAAVKEAAPDIHVHAFTPLEIIHGATTLETTVVDFLRRLRKAGLDSLPGTAAEILDDKVRAVICPDKINSRQWLEVMETAHRLGLASTATIMFGHMESPASWAIHLSAVRELQQNSRGFTEFIPLPFVHMEAPMYLRGGARPGPTQREAVLMHAVSRLVLNRAIDNVQVSWPKLGPRFAVQILSAGANDMGGTLMNESISRAAGACHGEELSLKQMEKLIRSAGRSPRQRTTTYGEVDNSRRKSALTATPSMPIVNRHLRDYPKRALAALTRP